MWLSKYWSQQESPSFNVRQSRFIDRDFQMRYTSLVVGAVAIGMAIAVLPIYKLVTENYEIFIKLSYDYAPQLLEYLERERVWITLILVSSFVGLVTFFSWLGFRMTSRIVGPLHVLRNHLRMMSCGHFSQDPIRIREKDEFQDLIEAYNYFYSSFRVNIKRDLQLLKAIQVDPSDHDSKKAWMTLIEEKALQLNEVDEIPGSSPKVIDKSA